MNVSFHDIVFFFFFFEYEAFHYIGISEIGGFLPVLPFFLVEENCQTKHFHCTMLTN